MAFKKIRDWMKQPIFKKPKKPQRLVRFGELGNIIGERAWLVMVLCIFIVIFAELLLRAEGIAVFDARYVWGAAALIGFLFVILAVWVLPEKFTVLNQLYLPGWASDLKFGLLAGLLAFAWTFLINQALGFLIPDLYSGMFFNNWLYSARYILMAIMGASALRPLGEELLFRKYFLGHFNKTRSEPTALLISSALYGLRTLDPFHFIIFFGTGLIYGWAANKKNIRTAIIGNITCSLLIILIIVINLNQMKAGICMH